ncbi:unnamed protein product [Euphydryas editha]|uniref:Cathepsin propeptide inhibitor domain-containing protein n=1 Tax=Euphydryas editha TaxID=104508 RepID=A0AAU9V3G3_EUPED|nr:unnamed protein product [Euphydryas editha]
MNSNLLLFFIVFMLFDINIIFSDDLQSLIYNLRDGPQLYRKYVEKFNKTFKGDEEYRDRYSNFMKTLRVINEINSQPGSEKVRPNKYADLSDFERSNIEGTTKIDPELKIQMKGRKPSVDSLFIFDV